MNSSEEGIYEDETFQDIDIGAIMRDGHPDIEEGDQHIVQIIGQLRSRLGRPLRILDIGSGSAHLSMLLARQYPDCEVVANEIASAPLAQAEAKLASYPNAKTFDRSFNEWNESVDAVISWGTHHHLSHDYLQHISKLLGSEGLLIIGDEFCPEYLTPSDQSRLVVADRLEIVDGYVFDNDADMHVYKTSGVVPEWSLQLEQARRMALWKWYKFVGDYAIARDNWMVLITELQIARDDLITKFGGEHKTSPFLLERELSLNGFTIIERAAIGNRPVALQSFVVFTCRPQSVS